MTRLQERIEEKFTAPFPAMECRRSCGRQGRGWEMRGDMNG